MPELLNALLRLELRVARSGLLWVAIIFCCLLVALLVAVTVIPALSNALMGGNTRRYRLPLPGIDHLARGFVSAVVAGGGASFVLGFSFGCSKDDGSGPLPPAPKSFPPSALWIAFLLGCPDGFTVPG